MAKYITLGQLKTQLDTMFRSLKAYLDGTLTAPVKSLAQQAKALADEVVRRADAGEFKGERGENGAPGRDGSDAEVTAANITAALGYTPVSADDYDPVEKTATMTQSVGKDSNGRLWTTPGGGGGGSAVWGGIAGNLDDQTDLMEALEAVAYDDTALKGRVTTIEGKEAGWNGKYSKPSGGIPKTDLASAVQTSLGKADSAVQDAPTDGKRYDRQSGAWAEAPSFANPNLLNNPWFTVNQRGATAFPSNGGYHVDRWRAWEAQGSIGSNGISFTGTIYQNMEPGIWNSLVGKTLTASFLLTNGTVLSFAPLVFSGTSTYFSGLSGYGAQLKADEKTFEFQRTGSAASIRALKLEIGAVSTIGLDVMPDYATELRKCRRFFWRLKTRGNYASTLWHGYCTSTNVRFTVFFPTIMRIRPTINADTWAHFVVGDAAGQTVTLSADTEISVSSMFGDDSSGTNCEGVRIAVPVEGIALTQNAACYIRNTGDSYIDFSADL